MCFCRKKNCVISFKEAALLHTDIARQVVEKKVNFNDLISKSCVFIQFKFNKL